MLTNDQVLEILAITAFDHCDALFWRVDAGVLSIYVMCSDTFDFASADCEEITPENLPVFRQAFTEAKAVDSGAFLAPYLFCARVRKRQPLEEWFKEMKDYTEILALFRAVEVQS